jgi:hypothetical protein
MHLSLCRLCQVLWRKVRCGGRSVKTTGVLTYGTRLLTRESAVALSVSATYRYIHANDETHADQVGAHGDLGDYGGLHSYGALRRHLQCGERRYVDSAVRGFGRMRCHRSEQVGLSPDAPCGSLHH